MIKTAVAIIGFIAAVFGIIQGLHWGYIEVMKKIKEPLTCLPVTLLHDDAILSGAKNEPARGNLFITPQAFQGKSTVAWRVDLSRDCSYQLKLLYSIHESRPLKVTVQHQMNLNWQERTEPAVVAERAFSEFQTIPATAAIRSNVETFSLQPPLKLKRGRNWITLETIDTALPHIESARLVP